MLPGAETDDLVAHNMGLAVKAARRYRGRCPDEDLEQAAMVGLIRAARSYDPDRVPHVKFSTYATRCITNEIGRLVWEQLWINLGSREGLDTLPDTCESAEVLVERIDIYERLAESVEGLSYVERVVLVERFGLTGRPVSRLELSAITGVGVDRIRAIEDQAIHKLRESLGVDGTDLCTSIQHNGRYAH